MPQMWHWARCPSSASTPSRPWYAPSHPVSSSISVPHRARRTGTPLGVPVPCWKWSELEFQLNPGPVERISNRPRDALNRFVAYFFTHRRPRQTSPFPQRLPHRLQFARVPRRMQRFPHRTRPRGQLPPPPAQVPLILHVSPASQVMQASPSIPQFAFDRPDRQRLPSQQPFGQFCGPHASAPRHAPLTHD